MFMTRKLGRLVTPGLIVTAAAMLASGASAGTPSTSAPSHSSTKTSTAKPAAHSGVAKSPITISLTSTMRHGNLVVLLDDVPVFNEEFQKPALIISQTTTWDPLQITAGKHKLTAKVYGTKKTYLSATYDLNVSRTKGSELRFLMKGDKLTVEVAS
jgi:hypothetical protein